MIYSCAGSSNLCLSLAVWPPTSCCWASHSNSLWIIHSIFWLLEKALLTASCLAKVNKPLPPLSVKPPSFVIEINIRRGYTLCSRTYLFRPNKGVPPPWGYNPPSSDILDCRLGQIRLCAMMQMIFCFTKVLNWIIYYYYYYYCYYYYVLLWQANRDYFKVRSHHKWN